MTAINTTLPNSTTPTTTTTASTTTSGTGQTTASAQQGLNSNYQDFLTLLTTQLKNQDPDSPLDTNQLTAQIAQLSQVEQSINTNSKLDQLVSLYTGTQTTNAVSYIGKEVDATGNQTELTGGSATLVYNLPSVAQSATVTVTDSTGKTVFSSAGTTTAGRNQLLWNGSTTSGTTAASGTYTFKVTAKDSTGKDLTPVTYTTGTVTSVDTQNGVSSLSLGKLSVPLSTVNSVYTAGTNPNA